MRQIDFLEVLENIDDKYIEEAETYKKARKRADVRILLAVAASLLVVIGVAANFVRLALKKKEVPPTTARQAFTEAETVTSEMPATTTPGFTEAYNFEPVNDSLGTQFILVSVRLEGDKANVKFTNISDEPWSFGEYYRLEVLIEGQWYYVPSEDYAVHDLMHEIGPGADITMTYDLSPFGELAPGDYRIACGGPTFNENVYYAYFTKTDDGVFIGTDPTGYPEGYTGET
ncbi:MAG: hypothetical protein IKZ29_01570 [Clostridiales bacterium]|nr:hypothetical protein [Clostridiales bacterium]